MRTSSGLYRKDTCSKNNADVTERQKGMVNAMIQKQVLKEALLGEIGTSLPELKAELRSLSDKNDIFFENRYEKEDDIELWAKRIKRYADYEKRPITIPEKADMFDEESVIEVPDENGVMRNTVVNMFGEDIRVTPDFIVDDPDTNTVTIGKIKTSKSPIQKNKINDTDFSTYETYAYGLLGQKLFPNREIHVEVDHLGAGTKEDEQLALPFILSDEDKKRLGVHVPQRNYIVFDEGKAEEFRLKHLVEEANREEDEEVVNEAACASCPKFNVCNYEEPPIPMALEKEVRPISDIHLSEEQSQAVAVREGTWRINAGAGAGKTLVIAFRVKEMLKEGVDPKKILLITFTNNGALEMKTRVENYASADHVSFNPEDLKMTTFNSFCQDIINEHYEELGFTRKPTVIPGELRMEEINSLLSKYPRMKSWRYPRTYNKKTDRFITNLAIYQADHIFTAIKENGYTRLDNPWSLKRGNIGGEVGTYDADVKARVVLTEEELDQVFAMYDEFNRDIYARNYIEFPDQINMVQDLYKKHPDLFNELGYEHIIVDEAQDTDLHEIRLLQAMKDTRCEKSFMFVGDDSQAIYGFRHTTPEYMIHFDGYFGEGNARAFNDLYLVENHRSNANIIDFANKINMQNTERVDKDLIATKPYVDNSVDVQGYYTEFQEIRGIAESVKKDIASGMKPYDIAILARTGDQLKQYAGELTRLGIPSILMNPFPYTKNSNCAAVCTFFHSYIYKTTQGVMDYINAKEHGSLKTASREEIDEKVNAMMDELRGRELSKEDFLEYVHAIDEEGKDPCFKDFIESKLDPCQTLDDMKGLFNALDLYGDMSTYKREGQYDGVTLITIHSAKGLEWDKVYYSLDKMDKKAFHSAFIRGDNLVRRNEEERLNFVAASRAREGLVVNGVYTIPNGANAPRGTVTLNNFLKDAFEMIEKPYEFQSARIAIERAHDKATIQAEAEERKEERESRVGHDDDEIEGQIHFELA